MSDEDQDAFRKAMHDVRPLRPRDGAPQAPKPPAEARFSRLERQQVLSESLFAPTDPAEMETGEELVFMRPGVPADVMRRLRRGQFAVETEIDLHGLGRHAAHDALRQFINECSARRLGCVRVIHGKGLGSGPRGPVIKHVVNRWLRRMDDVAAFVTARPVDGGTGALYVLLGRGAAGRARRRP